VLVDADTGRVDHDDVAVVTLGDRPEKSIPDTRLPPADEAVVAGGGRSVPIRDLDPRRSGPEPPENPVQNTAIVDPRHAARLVG